MWALGRVRWLAARKVRVALGVVSAALLLSGFWVGFFGKKTTLVPLLMEVSPEDSDVFVRLLAANGIEDISYDDMNQLLLVSPVQRASAYAVLAVNGLLPTHSPHRFEQNVMSEHFGNDL